MREKENAGIGRQNKEITLRESLVGSRGKLSKQLTSVARMINYLNVSLLEKRQLFFYHLWHENLSLGPIKEFIEIKEDPVSFIVDPVLKNNRLVRAYEEFYIRFEDKHRTKSRFQERMDEILPLRNVYTVAEISEKTSYPKEYVKGVFKRAIKKGEVKKLDKKEVATRDPQYAFYIKIREKVERMRNSSSDNYSEQEIASSLSQELGITVTKQQVKRQIRVLLREGKIKRRINQVK